MSKIIDTTDPENLTIAERLYLQDRGELPEGLKPYTQEERAKLDVELAPSVNEYKDWSRKQLCKELKARSLPLEGTKDELAERLRADDALNFVRAVEADKNAKAQQASAGEGDKEDDDAPDIEGMSKAELVALAEERGVDSSGKKADLIERLS